MRNSQQEIATGKSKKKSAFRYTKRITYIAVLVAVALLFKSLGNMFTIVGFRVSFVYIPWIIAGVMLGPVGGAAVALITDILGTFMIGQTPVPLIMLGNALYPIFPALVFRLPFKNGYLKTVIGAVCSLLLCTLGLNTAGLIPIYEMSFWQILVVYRLPQIGVFVINIALIGILFPLIRRTMLKALTE